MTHNRNTRNAQRQNRRRYSKNNRRKSNDRYSYDALEPRQLLAFAGFFDGTTLTLTQTVDDGAIIVDNNGAGTTFRTTDGSGTTNYVVATNVIVDLLDGTGNQLDLDLDSAHTGNVELNLGDGARLVNFTGSSNSIGGDLAVNSGTDAQTIEIARVTALSITGSATFSLGLGFDVVDEDARNITVGSDWTMIDVNRFENSGTMNVGGNVLYDTTADDDTGDFDNDTIMNIVGNFTYLGNSLADAVQTNADFNLVGNYLADVGDGGSNFQLNTSDIDIDGTITLLASGIVGNDNLNMVSGLTIGGNILVNLGDGTNAANFSGTFNGSEVRYLGGMDSDSVSYGGEGTAAFVVVKLGAGDDSFTILPGAVPDPNALRVDFAGGGNDLFVNNFGAPLNFNIALVNWDNFNRFYSFSNDQWRLVQIGDDGVVTLDANGAGGAIRLSNTLTTVMTASANVRLDMMPDTGNVLVDLDAAFAGNMVLNLRRGDRTVDFVGTNNSVGRLNIEAAAGDQQINLAVNNDLNVTSHVAINLRGGDDVVDESGNNLNIGGDLILRGVNTFENGGTASIGGNLTSNNTFFDEPARLDNDGILNIAGRLSYFGGVNRDDLSLNNVSVGGPVFINLGTNTSSLAIQTLNLTGGFIAGSSVKILGGTSLGGNFVTTDGATSIAGPLSIDFSASTTNNTVNLLGTHLSNYGIFKGGSAVDNLMLNLNAGDMSFVAKLGDGDDILTLGGGTSLFRLFANFGNGIDTFNDGFGGAYPFPTTFTNLP